MRDWRCVCDEGETAGDAVGGCDENRESGDGGAGAPREVWLAEVGEGESGCWRRSAEEELCGGVAAVRAGLLAGERLADLHLQGEPQAERCDDAC